MVCAVFRPHRTHRYDHWFLRRYELGQWSAQICSRAQGGSLLSLHTLQYPLFIVSRIIFGSGLSFAQMISPVIIQEIAHPAQRPTVAAMFNMSRWHSVHWHAIRLTPTPADYAYGGFICAWFAFGMSYVKASPGLPGCCHSCRTWQSCSTESRLTFFLAALQNNWSWRTMYIVQVVPALYLLIAIQFVPETPRWLLSKGREDEALAFLVKYVRPHCSRSLYLTQDILQAPRRRKPERRACALRIRGDEGNAAKGARTEPDQLGRNLRPPG